MAVTLNNREGGHWLRKQGHDVVESRELEPDPEDQKSADVPPSFYSDKADLSETGCDIDRWFRRHHKAMNNRV
jgi:hypothetical protein